MNSPDTHEIARAEWKGRIEQKLDYVVETNKATVDLLKAMDTRLTRLEHWRSWLAGALATVTLIGGYALTQMGVALKKLFT